MVNGIFVCRLQIGDTTDFVCKDEDLNGFFRDDSQHYLRELLAVTYSIESDGQIIGMFSLCNDRLDIHDFFDDRKKLKKAAAELPHLKRGLKNFPAVKIARLAISKGFEGKGLGRAIVAFIQFFLLIKNKTGCRFLTVDAYPNAINFYEKVGFKKVLKNDPQIHLNSENDNVLMYMDLGIMATSPLVLEFAPIIDQLLSGNRAEFKLA